MQPTKHIFNFKSFSTIVFSLIKKNIASTRGFFTLNLNQKPIVTIFPTCLKVCKILILKKTGNRKQDRFVVYYNIFQK